MKQFTIFSSESSCSDNQNHSVLCLHRNVQAYYHDEYHGGGNWKIPNTIENLICTLKNDITPYSDFVLSCALKSIKAILYEDLRLIFESHNQLRVCVVPRAKCESIYKSNQLLFRQAVRDVVLELSKSFIYIEDGTHDIVRRIDTKTTHRSYFGYGGDGVMPYDGITKDTCYISNSICGKNILLIDDVYTRSVNVDEDCIQAIYD